MNVNTSLLYGMMQNSSAVNLPLWVIFIWLDWTQLKRTFLIFFNYANTIFGSMQIKCKKASINHSLCVTYLKEQCKEIVLSKLEILCTIKWILYQTVSWFRIVFVCLLLICLVEIFCFASTNTDLQIVHLQLSLKATHIKWNNVIQKILSVFYIPEEMFRISLLLYIVPSFSYWSSCIEYLSR